LRLSKNFGNSAKFWLGLQDDFDIEEELSSKQKEIKGIKKIRQQRSITQS
jgi:antitoxin HigA-1